jgi:hypothetical protein
MIKLTVHLLRTFLIVLFLKSSALAQKIKDDSLFVAQVTENITNNYLILLKSDAPIFNGKMYRPNSNFDEGTHTLFINNQYTLGSIFYDEILYKDMNIMYDLVLDQLILLNFDKVGGLVVFPHRVKSFKLHEHTFINIQPDSLNKKNISSGYYDLLVEGKVNFLAKRSKKIQETTNQEKVKRIVYQQDKYFLLKDDIYYSIKNKNELLKQLKVTHDQNQQYIKSNKLKFKKNKEESMIRLVKFHDSINL